MPASLEQCPAKLNVVGLRARVLGMGREYIAERDM